MYDRDALRKFIRGYILCFYESFAECPTESLRQESALPLLFHTTSN